MIEQQNTQGGPAAELRALAEQVQALRAEVRYLAGNMAEAKKLQYEAMRSADPADKAEYQREYEKYSKLAAKSAAKSAPKAGS